MLEHKGGQILRLLIFLSTLLFVIACYISAFSGSEQIFVEGENANFTISGNGLIAALLCIIGVTFMFMVRKFDRTLVKFIEKHEELEKTVAGIKATCEERSKHCPANLGE